MAHHQHHGADYDAQVSRSLSIRPKNTSSTSHMPALAEDEVLNEPDEPPELYRQQLFKKSIPSRMDRRQSLLTRALSTDTESHDEQPEQYFGHLPSVSSTASNFSSRSNDFTSDDGHHSPSTRASTPSSPRSVTNVPKILLHSDKTPLHASPKQLDSDSSRKSSRDSGDATPEPTVEAQLGRKRCITFACGGKGNAAPKPAAETAPAAPAKRPCALKFVCPFTAAKQAKADLTRTSRHLSPAPVVVKTDNPRIGFHRRHRDSDTTIKNESPKSPKASPIKTTFSPIRPRRGRRASNNSDLGQSEACRFHEFGHSDEEVEEWTKESTCHKSRMTVSDTLAKENAIRQLAEEADEEDELEAELQKSDDDIDEDSLSDDASEDEGFKTDDEDGFAESDDDENESDSDYEWWAPRRSRNASPFIGSDVFRPVVLRKLSDSSISSSDDEAPSQSVPRGRKRNPATKVTREVAIPVVPELPDSTDFVCGTLDEDRPLEQEFMSCVQQRKAAKHRACPQDIDPSFPTSDPEIENDDDEEEGAVEESDNYFVAGRMDRVDSRTDSARGRRLSPAPMRSPRPSPRPLTCKKLQLARSPAPRALFNQTSPRRMRSPPPVARLTSPPPSPKNSAAGSTGVKKGLSIAQPMLGQRNANLTYTASLPRSPHPFSRIRKPSPAVRESSLKDDSDEDEGEVTEHAKPYHRGAVDIHQGLEKKRLKRREKFYKQYCKKEEKKKSRRPCPGKGAERMRQVGLECAVLRGKRMLSI